MLRKLFAWLCQPCTDYTQLSETDKLLVREMTRQATIIGKGEYISPSPLPAPTIPDRRMKERK